MDAFYKDVHDFVMNAHLPFTIDDLLKALKRKRYKKRYERFLFNHENLLYVEGVYYPKIYVLKDIPFRILPTEFELNNKFLIPGHRMIPFNPIMMEFDEFTLLSPTGKPFNKTLKRLKMKDIGIFFSLLPIYRWPIKDVFDILNPNAKVEICIYDLSDFYKANNFSFGDTIIVKIEDFSKGIYRLYYSSKQEMQENIFKIRRFDNEFKRCLKEVLDYKLGYSSVEKQLFYTYFLLWKKKIKIDTPGQAFGPFISNNKDIRFSHLVDGTVLLHYSNQPPELPNLEDILDEMYEYYEDRDFDLNTIDGILQYLGNNNSETTVRAIILDQISRSKQSYEDLCAYIFCDLPYPYLPPDLEKVFKKRVFELYKRLEKEYAKQPDPIHVTYVRRKLLDLSLEISKFLRWLDRKGIELSKLPKEGMFELMQIGSMVHWCLDMLEDKESMDNNEKDVMKLLDSLKIVEEILPTVLETIRSKILTRLC